MGYGIVCPICGEIWYSPDLWTSTGPNLNTYLYACPRCKKLLEDLYKKLKREVKNRDES